MLVLEELERAQHRGAVIYAEVLGLGSSFDAYAVTKPDPLARGAARAIRWALNEAHIDRQDVDYINAHGTSTRPERSDGDPGGQALSSATGRRSFRCPPSNRWSAT